MQYLVLRDIYNFAAGDDRSTIPTCIFVNTLSLWCYGWVWLGLRVWVCTVQGCEAARGKERFLKSAAT